MSTIKKIIRYSAITTLAFEGLIMLLVVGFLKFSAITHYKTA